MTLTEAVIYLNREMEDLAIKKDFTTLQKLSFVKKQIMDHTCQKPKGKKKHD